MSTMISSKEGSKQAVLVIAGTSSGVGKTTTTVGLMAAFSRRGLIVQPFKCGPDFLDGMHHEAAIRAGEREWIEKQKLLANNDKYMKPTASMTPKDHKTNASTTDVRRQRKCVNLDGWMMGSNAAVIASFAKHSRGADICIIEGVMGLHDSRDGISDEGSTAQIAKLLNVPVVLVIDGSMMARSVAAMALGYALFDSGMRLGAVISNKVGGMIHTKWIAESIEKEGNSSPCRFKDVGTNEPIFFAGALPQDTSASVPERHLGLTMPKEEDKTANPDSLERFTKLAILVEENLDLDALIRLGQTCQLPPLSIDQPILKQELSSKRCRIGIAEDDAFCFYYRDNLILLELAGADIIPFSPLASPRLPPKLDGLYIGGGYPELHAEKLEMNKPLRDDIASFSKAGGTVFAECGGLVYLSERICVSKNEPAREMCGVLPFAVRMTPHMKMYYADIEFTSSNPIFPSGKCCRGQKFHFSEVVIENPPKSQNGKEQNGFNSIKSPFLVTPQLPGSKPEQAGIVVNNTFASYFHLHFSSFNEKYFRSSNNKAEGSSKSLADHFVENAISTSPRRGAYAVSFVSAATEIIFALEAQSTLAGVTSLCDFPLEARSSPRQIVCRSPIDAASMTSEEVSKAMSSLRAKNMNEKVGPPGYWLVNKEALMEIQPRVVFVQNTCDICDPSSDDVLYALRTSGLEKGVACVQVAPTTLDGVFDSIQKIAIKLNVEKRGIHLVATLKSRLKNIETAVAKFNSPRPRILSLAGLAPLCTGGNWLPDLKRAAGCDDALGDIGGCAAHILCWKEIQEADPDILMISPCSASPTRTLNELHLLASSPEFWSLRCVQKGDVYVIDHGIFSRPGPRLVEGVEMMAALFCNVPPPSTSIYKKWSKEALKYQFCNDGRENSILHCTTELAVRFSPCFRVNPEEKSSSLSILPDVETKKESSFQLCNVTRCTIGGKPLPSSRSAHCIVPVKRKGSRETSLLLIGGESDQGKRLNDTWELHPPSKGWSALAKRNNESLSKPVLGTIPTWEYLVCGKVAGENVPTKRSNHAAVVCGDHILTFGGWGVDNVTPLSNCELLHIESLCWTHCSTRGSSEPSPRGNPTLVYSTKCNSAFLFGGWNGKYALNDLWRLDMTIWQWQEMKESIIMKGNTKKISWPSPRTDHSAVLWKKKDGYESMLVFGGNVQGFGPCSELWEFTYSVKSEMKALNEIPHGKESFSWDNFQISGPCPPARTSHTASIVGTGFKAKMVIVGGTDSSRGAGRGSMLCDAWVLHLFHDQHDPPTWIKFEWSGAGMNRCRHSMSFVNSNMFILWGGYDGDITVNDSASVWRGSLKESSLNNSTYSEEEESVEIEKEEEAIILQDRWEAEIPVRMEDLPPEMLAKAKRSRLPGAVYKALHRYAVANNRDTYIDPASGYSVFSTVYLKRKPCCGNGCRHCPHGHINVPKKKNLCKNKDPKLDW